MPRNFCEISGNVLIDDQPREKLIRVYGARNGSFFGEGFSSPTDGSYSFDILKERGTALYGIALSDYGDTWAANKTVAVGDKVIPFTVNGHWYVCKVAGTTGETEPTWGIGEDTADGTVVWEDQGQMENAIIRGPFTVDPEEPEESPGSFLLRFQNDLIDDVGDHRTTFNGVAAHFTQDDPKWGQYCLRTDDNSWVESVFLPMSEDFTIEAWVDFRDVPAGAWGPIVGCGLLATNPWRISLYMHSDGRINFLRNMSASSSISAWSLASDYPREGWFHIAADRYGNTNRLFINGKLVAQSEDTYTGVRWDNGASTRIGSAVDSSTNRTGKVRFGEVRISEFSRYQGQEFTPPTRPYVV